MGLPKAIDLVWFRETHTSAASWRNQTAQCGAAMLCVRELRISQVWQISQQRVRSSTTRECSNGRRNVRNTQTLNPKPWAHERVEHSHHRQLSHICYLHGLRVLHMQHVVCRVLIGRCLHSDYVTSSVIT